MRRLPVSAVHGVTRLVLLLVLLATAATVPVLLLVLLVLLRLMQYLVPLHNTAATVTTVTTNHCLFVVTHTHTVTKRWGCPRGRGCDFAHGEDELKGDEATATKKRKADSEKAQVRTTIMYFCSFKQLFFQLASSNINHYV
jgi:hypothetical protein